MVVMKRRGRPMNDEDRRTVETFKRWLAGDRSVWGDDGLPVSSVQGVDVDVRVEQGQEEHGVGEATDDVKP